MNEKLHDQQPQLSQQGYPPSPYYYPAPHEENEINFFDLWAVIWNYKRIIFLITILFTSVALAVALHATPIYRAEVLLAPVTEEKSSNFSSLDSQLGGLAALSGINFGSSASKHEAIAFFKSRVLAEQFIRDEGLLPILFSDSWDFQNKKWNVENEEDIPTMWDAYKIFNKGVRSVSVDIKTGLVTLSIEWKDPKLCAEWASKLVNRVNEYMRNRTVQDAENNLKYLKEALTKTSSVELHEAIYRIIESQIKVIMFAKAREEYSFKIIDPPVIPQQKIRPKRRQIVIIGFILGLMVGVFITFFSNFVKEKIISERNNAK